MRLPPHKAAACLVICLLLAAWGCRTQVTTSIPDEKPRVLARFAMISDDRRPVILLPVTIEDETYSFILDTGSSVTVFDISLAENLKGWHILPARGKDSTGTALSAPRKDAPDTYIGPLNLKDSVRSIVVMDLGPLNAHAGVDIDGIVGMDFLEDYVVRIDPEKNVVSFMESRPERGLFGLSRPRVNCHREWGKPVAIRFGWNNLPYIKGRFHSAVETDFLVDTGHGGLNVDLDSKTFTKVAGQGGQWQSKGLTVGVTGTKVTRDSANAFVDGFSLGAIEYDSVLFREDRDSCIGLVFLSHHLSTFDFPNRTLYLKQIQQLVYGDTIEIDMAAFGFTIKRRDGELVVETLEPQETAHLKGLRKGDVVVAINGRDAETLSVAQLIDLLSAVKANPANLHLTVQRGRDTLGLHLDKAHIP